MGNDEKREEIQERMRVLALESAYLIAAHEAVCREWWELAKQLDDMTRALVVR